jgi:hypothetical protein
VYIKKQCMISLCENLSEKISLYTAKRQIEVSVWMILIIYKSLWIALVIYCLVMEAEV